MKKTASVLLILILLFVSACSTKQEETIQEEKTTQTEEIQSETSTEVTETDNTETVSVNGQWIDEESGEPVFLIDLPYIYYEGYKVELSDAQKDDYRYMFVIPFDESPTKEATYYIRLNEDSSAELWFEDFTGLYDEDFVVCRSLNRQSEETLSVEENTNTDKPSDNENTSKGHWEERTVLVRDAWDEQVVVKEGWTEQILIKEGWTETHEECAEYTQDEIPVYVCRANGQSYYDGTQCAYECESSFYKIYEYGEPYCSRYETRTIEHPAEYNYIEHEPEYKTVHHEAEYKTETVWVED